MSAEEITERLRAVEDRLALQELVARYCLAVDDRDYDALLTLFATDAVMVTRAGEITGRADVVAFLEASRERQGQTVHTPHAQVVELDGDRASGTVLAHVELGVGGETHYGAARYHDRYVRAGGRWRFASRELRFTHLGPWSEVGAALLRDDPVRWPATP